MPEQLARFLDIVHGSTVLRISKLCFLILLTLAVLFIVSSPRVKPGKSSYTLLRLIFLLMFSATLVYQATWQLTGHARPEFVKFMRRYNRRPNAAQMQTLRGPLLDRRGMVLTAPVPGEVWERYYPLGAAGVHPLGYSHARFGLAGVEWACDPTLSGYAMENTNRWQRHLVLAPRSEEGAAQELTLDSRLQKKAYSLLEGRKGAVIIMQPATGALLALVSSPGFDPVNPAFALQDKQNQPALNRATQGVYPPGSVLKILVAVAGLEQGVAGVIPCPALGYIAAPATPAIRDNEYYAAQRRGRTWRGWGNLGLEAALKHSSNVYFAQLGVACGVERFAAVMQRAQLDQKFVYLEGSGGKLRSSKGNIPDVKRASELAHLGIGQGKMLVTPLHVACFTSAIAYEGRLMKPNLLKESQPVELTQLCSAPVARELRRMLRQAVVSGTGRGADIRGMEVCGKTGTAEVSGQQDHAWFTCFAPEKKPIIMVTVLIENGGFGAQSAVPVARQLLLYSQKLGYLR